MFGRIPIAVFGESHDSLSTAALFQNLSTHVNLLGSERVEVKSSVLSFSELQQVLPYLPDEHSNKEGNYYGRITQPVVNFLLAKLALNAEIYMYDDWTQGYANRPKGSDIHFYGASCDGCLLRNGGKVRNSQQEVECLGNLHLLLR